MIFLPPLHTPEQVRKASPEERQRMFEEWNGEMARLNPRYLHPDGTPKKWWRVLLGL